MLEAGTSLHLASSGRLILRAKADLKPGTILYDDKGRKVAKAVEIFGPVKTPYISAIPLTDRVKKSLGRKVYTSKRGSKVVEARE
ncbi:MAG: H/ACA ribonucleoprotein complex subunit GAR1 [Nitrososphaerales archaeon]